MVALLGLLLFFGKESDNNGVFGVSEKNASSTIINLSSTSTPTLAVAGGGSYGYIKICNEGSPTSTSFDSLIRYTINSTSTGFNSNSGGATIFAKTCESFEEGKNLPTQSVWLISATTTLQKISVLKF